MHIRTATKIIMLSTATLLFFGTRLSDDALLFFMVGAIPGTSHNIPSNVMLTLIILAVSWVGYCVARAHGLDRRFVATIHAAKHALTRRNFSDAA